MILIADSGATSTRWALIRDSEKEVEYIDTPGFNPNYRPASEMASEILAALPVSASEIRRIRFFGAGVTALQEAPTAQALAEVFPNATSITAETDLIGSCRALLGDGEGFAAILGTGLGTCIFAGGKVQKCIPGFGFIMGDEGSGGYIGKRLLVDFIRGNMPEKVRELTDKTVGKDYSQLVQRIYREPNPNAYCASFCRFVDENRDFDPYFTNLVIDSFRQLFKNVVCLYPEYQKYSFNSVGSVAWVFREELQQVASEYGMKVGKIVRDPLPELATYYKKELSL